MRSEASTAAGLRATSEISPEGGAEVRRRRGGARRSEFAQDQVSRAARAAMRDVATVRDLIAARTSRNGAR